MCTMTSLVKKVLKSGINKPNGSTNSLKPPQPPVCPPSPDLSGLTPEEVHILNEVFRRQELFEEEEKTRTRRLQNHIESFEEQIQQHATSKSRKHHADLRLCRLCFKNKFADGIGRVCQDCRRRVCNKCGSFTRPKWDHKRNKSVRGKWQCTMCQMKRELLCQTGIWFHGSGSKPTFNRKSFKAKIEATGYLETESDWAIASDRRNSEPALASLPGHRTDSELLINAKNTTNDTRHTHKFHRRRSQLSITDSLQDKDDDDSYVDDATFKRERQQDRKHRSQKKCRKRLPKLQNNQSLDSEHTHRISVNYDSPYSSANSVESASDGRVESKVDAKNSRSPTKSRSRETQMSKQNRSSRRRRKSPYSDVPLTKADTSERTSPKSTGSQNHSKSQASQSHGKIVRQGAVSRSSSSTSIISDAKSSDIHSSAASPVFHRHDTLQFRESPKISIRTSSMPSASVNNLDLVLPTDGGPQLLAPPTPTSHRRVTLSECENITINTTGEQGRYHPSTPHAVLIHRDKNDASYRTGGLGMRIVGGKTMADGSVGAYVTHVVKGGPADAQAGIKIGDVILEWNGRSLQNATFEESREIMDKCEDIVQLLVLHVDNGEQSRQPSPTPSKSRIPKSDSVDGQLVHKTFNTDTLEPPKESSLIARPKRRMLPKTPIEIKKETKQISGRLLLQLSYSPATSRLTVATIRAEGLKPRGGSTKTLPRPLLLLYLLPGRNDTGHYETQPGYETTNPEWNKTFIFADITGNTIQDKALEVTVWDKTYCGDDDFLGEVLLDLKDANLDNEAVWFNLEDHDDNSSPLPLRKKSFSDISPLSSSSSIDLLGQRSQGVRTPSPNFSGRRSAESQRCLPLTPAHDKAKQLLNRGKTSPCRDSRSDKDTSRHSSPLPSPGSMTDPGNRGALSIVHRDSFTKKVKRKMSSAVTKIVGEKKESDDDRDSCSSHGWLGRSRSIDDLQENSLVHGRSPRSHRRSTIHMDLLAPPRPLSRTPSETSFDDDDGDSYSFNSRAPDRPAPEGDDITSLLGPGQAPPKPSMEKVILGDIKLGFMVSKGQLEVDVICAKCLTRGPAPFPPDTYVKTYLMEGNKKIQKKKTKLVKSSYEPIYRQKLKYSACNVYGRAMRINIWERQKTFDKKVSLGEVVVRLDNLDLSQHAMGWYKLFQISATDLGSTDSLLNW